MNECSAPRGECRCNYPLGMKHRWSDDMVCAMPDCGISWETHQVMPAVCPSSFERCLKAITSVRGPRQDVQIFTLQSAMGRDVSVRELGERLGLSLHQVTRSNARGRKLATESRLDRMRRQAGLIECEW